MGTDPELASDSWETAASDHQAGIQAPPARWLAEPESEPPEPWSLSLRT
jgi:hypothetical protein